MDNQKAEVQVLSRKTKKLETSAIIILTVLSILYLSIFFYFLHLRLLEIEKARCEVWHWQVCDEVLAKKGGL